MNGKVHRTRPHLPPPPITPPPPPPHPIPLPSPKRPTRAIPQTVVRHTQDVTPSPIENSPRIPGPTRSPFLSTPPPVTPRPSDLHRGSITHPSARPSRFATPG